MCAMSIGGGGGGVTAPGCQYGGGFSLIAQVACTPVSTSACVSVQNSAVATAVGQCNQQCQSSGVGYYACYCPCNANAQPLSVIVSCLHWPQSASSNANSSNWNVCMYEF